MKIGNIEHDRKNWKFGEKNNLQMINFGNLEKKSFTDDKFWKYFFKIELTKICVANLFINLLGKYANILGFLEWE